MNTGNIYFIIF